MATDARSSQVLAEVWVVSDGGAVRVSQVIAESWTEGQTPPVRVSQALAETWVRQIPAAAFVASQAVAEVWIEQPAPSTWRRYQQSSSVV